MRFLRELEKGNPVYIYLLDGEYIEAVKVIWNTRTTDQDRSWIDVEDAEGDWTSINLAQITCVVPASVKKKK